MIAARSLALPPLSFMRLRSPISVRPVAAAVVGLLVACSEPTTSVRRFAILDDVGAANWRSVSVGGEHTCAIDSNGSVYCWGSNELGQLGIARPDTVCGTEKARYACSLVPRIIDLKAKFLSISAGAKHTCGITVARDAYCWGSNIAGQVAQLVPSGASAVKVPSLLGWTSISAGSTHTCAVRTDGAAFCWGSNDRGQLGMGTTAEAGMSRVLVNAPIAAIGAGLDHACARVTTGAVYCWGATWIGREGGLEMTRSQPTPVEVPSAPTITTLSVGAFTTCGTDALGIVYCWEGNPRGELGDGTQNGSVTPRRVASDLRFVQVSAGIVQTCGVATSGTAYCWGDNTFGQLGVSPSVLTESCGGQRLPCSTTPVAVAGRQRFIDVSTGAGSHSCGVTTLGNLYCWGLGLSGQRGDGTALYAISVPIQVKQP